MKSEKLTLIVRWNGRCQAFNHSLFTIHFLLFCCVFALIPAAVHAQTIAILTPDNTETSKIFAKSIQQSLGKTLKVIDLELGESAYSSTNIKTPFNLTTEEGKHLGTVIGCDFFVLIRSATQRRSAYQRTEYYESYAAVYVVSTRSGRLQWNLEQFEAARPEQAAKLMNESVNSVADAIIRRVRIALRTEIAEKSVLEIESVPEENSPLAKNFRAPVPYRRIKPEYTTQAALYDVAATVDMEVDTDERGTILRTEIVRWAGFGLDESVEKAVRSMTWRPAERNGKPLPMRFLVRYNFKKIEKE